MQEGETTPLPAFPPLFPPDTAPTKKLPFDRKNCDHNGAQPSSILLYTKNMLSDIGPSVSEPGVFVVRILFRKEGFLSAPSNCIKTDIAKNLYLQNDLN